METVYRSLSILSLGAYLGAGLGLCLASLAGCDGPAGGADLGSPDLGAQPDGGDPRVTPPTGSVYAVEVRTPYSMVDDLTASFFGQEDPGFHREAKRAGACRLLQFQPAQCDNFCIGVCVDMNVCKPFPSRISAGALTFSGMKVPVTLQPQTQNYYYADPPITADLFNAGDPITVKATGAEYGAFMLTSPGVATLETAAVVNDEIKLDDSADYTFTWTPGSDPRARMRLTLNANNRGHGMPYEAIIECDGPDSGSLTIAKDLIVPFPSTYRWEICAGRDCPLSSAMRYTQAEGQAGSRKVVFTVGSRRLFWVLHRTM